MCLNLYRLIVVVMCLHVPGLCASDDPFSKLTEHQQLSEDILRELAAFESTEEHPELVRQSLEAVESRLLSAGFDQQDIQIMEPTPGNLGMIARYRGMGDLEPALVLAHIDVVTVVADEWTFPPFALGKKDGLYLGRGTADNKAGVTEIVSNFVRLRNEGYVPGRDVIAVITGNEESSAEFAKWVTTEGRSLVEAEFAINTDAGGGELTESGKHRSLHLQTGEKMYQTYQLTARNRGGHSSVPRPDNAIRDLALAIARFADHKFPVILNQTTRLALERSAKLYPEEIARDMLKVVEDPADEDAVQRLAEYDPSLNSMLRTTCVPTMLNGGHAENALPREASVVVNCRIMPGTGASEIEAVIAGLVDGLGIEIGIIWDGDTSPVSELPDALLEQVETLSGRHFGNIPVIPYMSTGATDGLFFRMAGIPVYGISGLFGVQGGSGAHGLDERIGIKQFHDAVEFMYDLLKSVTK
jgi:acetylornithine deacetylase/succinyl-diaminopimelate desuccinylase-like protein